MTSPVHTWSDEQEREYVIDLLKRRSVMHSEENVIYCEKAFVINSILKMCFRKSKKKTQSKEQWVKYLTIVDSYIKDKTIIKWKNGKFEVYEI